MKHNNTENFGPFIPTDVWKVVNRLKLSWSKLSDADIEGYVEGKRHELINALQVKYGLTADQADAILSDIERLI